MGLAAAAEDAAEDLALATKAAAVSLPAGMLSPSSAMTARCALPFPPPWDGQGLRPNVLEHHNACT